MSGKSAKSEEYHRLAAEAAALAVASPLDHVREKHETAALQWTALAISEENRRRGSAVQGSSEARTEGLCLA